MVGILVFGKPTRPRPSHDSQTHQSFSAKSARTLISYTYLIIDEIKHGRSISKFLFEAFAFEVNIY